MPSDSSPTRGTARSCLSCSRAVRLYTVGCLYSVCYREERGRVDRGARVYISDGATYNAILFGTQI